MIAALRWLGDSGDARAALHLAVDLLWFWVLSGSPEEAMAWISFALAVPGETDPIDRLIAEGIVEIVDGDRRTTAAPGDALDDLAQRVDESTRATHPLLALARPVLALFAGETTLVEARLAETLEHPDPWVRAAATLMRAQLAENRGDQTHMRADLERAADMFRALGDDYALAMTLSSLAGTMSLTEELDEAETVLDEAMELLQELNGSSGAGLLRMRLSEIRARRGDIRRRPALAEESLEDLDLGRDEAIFVRAMVARLAWLAGDLDDAAHADGRGGRADGAGRSRSGPSRGTGRRWSSRCRRWSRWRTATSSGRPRSRTARSSRRPGPTDMPIVAMAGVVAATVARPGGRGRGRRDDARRRRGAAGRRGSGQPGDRAAGGGSPSSGL